MSFYLRYSNDNWGTNTSLEITKFIRNVEIPFNEKITGFGLRGNHYEFTNWSKKKRQINVSADFLASNSNYQFFIDFWNAGAKQYSADGETWTDVIVEGGDLPVELIEGHKYLRDIDITLINMEAD